MIDLTVLLVIGFASYRITRALLFDTWIEGLRQRWYVWLVNGQNLSLLREKTLELSSCSFCLGFWISLSLMSLYAKTYPWGLGIEKWISVFAIAGVQSMIHVLEPDD